MKVKFVTSSLNFDATSFWLFAEPKWCRCRCRFVLRICQKKEACWAVERVYKSPGRRAGVALCECWTSWASLTGSPPAGGHCWTAAAKHLGTSSCSNPVGGGHKNISHCLMDLPDMWIQHQVHRSIDEWIVKLGETTLMGEAAFVKTCGVKHTSSRPSCPPSCLSDETNCPQPRLSNDRDKSCFIVRRRCEGRLRKKAKKKIPEEGSVMLNWFDSCNLLPNRGPLRSHCVAKPSSLLLCCCMRPTESTSPGAKSNISCFSVRKVLKQHRLTGLSYSTG